MGLEAKHGIPHQAGLWVELVGGAPARRQNGAPGHRHSTAEAPARTHRVLLLTPVKDIDLHIIPAPDEGNVSSNCHQR